MTIPRTWTPEIVSRLCTEEGECLLWQGPVTSGGYPKVHVNGIAKSLRTYLFCDLLGKRKHSGQQIVARCGNKLCVSEKCLMAVTRSSSVSRAVTKKLALDPVFARNLRLRSPRVKLNEHLAAEVRQSPLSHRDVAKKYGVSAETARQIRCGETWKVIAPINSVFNLGG
jgi:hypothetical protein